MAGEAERWKPFSVLSPTCIFFSFSASPRLCVQFSFRISSGWKDLGGAIKKCRTQDQSIKRFFTLEYWMDGGWCVGRLKEVPGVLSQGETLEEPKDNIADAYRMMIAPTAA